MLQEERFNRILAELDVQGAVKNVRLADLLNVSESTIRRDINELDHMGRLKKVFGGAVELKQRINTVEEDVSIKASVNVTKKDTIAQYAAALIEDHDFVFIDAGTTTERMIDYIRNKTATYMTNGIVHAQKLSQRGFKTHIIGGNLRSVSLSIIGAEAVKYIEKYNFTKCFMGTNGIDVKRGFTTPNPEEAMLKTEAINHSKKVYILADTTKFNRISAATFANLSEVCVITDELIDDSYRDYIVVEEVK